MSETPADEPAFEARRRKLRLSAFGVLVVLILAALLILASPHEGNKERVFHLVMADVVFAGVICLILVFTLRKR